MGISNKLGVFCIGVNLLLPNLAQALIIEPIKIDSSQGEPLYAEIPFQQANNQNPLQVSIAQPFELGKPEAVDPNKFSHYNFYVRQNNQGNGVIVITSNRPINDNNLNLTVKINDSGQVHIQQIRHKLPSRIERLQSSLQETPLQPRIVVDEKALALNLPVTKDQASATQQLTVHKSPPPMLNQKNTVVASAPQNNNTHSANTVISIQSAQPPALQKTPPQPVVSENLTIQVSNRSTNDSVAVPQNNQVGLENRIAVAATTQPPANNVDKIKPSPDQVTEKPIIHKENTSRSAGKPERHKVQANESLWAIANQIAKSQNVPISKVMAKIHQTNSHAFINGKANRLKQGAILNIPTEYQAPLTAKREKTQKTIQTPPPSTQAQSSVKPTGEKQQQAHMSIVANDAKGGAAQGTNKAGQAHSTQQNELTVQLKQERSSTLTLQNNVKQLDQQLKQKEKRIALLNARLAELEQQLKLRQNEQNSKDASKTSSRSQSIVPAIVAGTLVAFAELNFDFGYYYQ